MRAFYRGLQTCWKFHDKGINRNETVEETQGRLKSAAQLNRTTRQSLSRLASPSRRSVIWPVGSGGLDEQSEKDHEKARQVC